MWIKQGPGILVSFVCDKLSDWHSPISQVAPVKPGGHVHVNLSNKLSQVAPLAQGLL